MLDPPWPTFSQLLKRCLDLAAQVANATGRERDELFEYIFSQERYAEQAFENQNAKLYRECFDNLERYAGYLGQMLSDTLPRPASQPIMPPHDEATANLEHFRASLAKIWKKVKARGRNDLDPRLTNVANQARGLSQRIKSDPIGVIREARRLDVELNKIEEALTGHQRQSVADDAGLLEGSS